MHNVKPLVGKTFDIKLIVQFYIYCEVLLFQEGFTVKEKATPIK